MTRVLFVNWKDGSSSQISVPDDYQLPRTLGLRRRRRPHTLIVPKADSLANIEIYLDVPAIRSATLVTIAADQRILDTTA